jgi:hypothetical protein
MSTPNVFFHNKISHALAALVFSVLSMFLASAQDSASSSSGMQPGYILVVEAVGDAKILTPEKPEGAVAAAGMNLRIGDHVVTATGGRVGLAFSNGSLFEVSENSKFSVQEFLQEPWKFSSEDWKNLENEPTKSSTKTYIEYGELAVKVKKLDEGSSMQVSTPLGVAGIRGTTFRIRVVRNTDGSTKAVTVQLVEGRVNFTPQGGGETTAITPGNSVTVSVNLGPDGQIQIPPPIEERLAPEEVGIIQEIIQRLLENNETIGSFGDTTVQPSTGGQSQTAVESRPQPMENITVPPIVPPPTPTPAPTAPAPTPAPTAPTPTPVPSGL